VAHKAIAKNHGVVVIENLKVNEMTKTGRESEISANFPSTFQR
jgi:hypothetical protein